MNKTNESIANGCRGCGCMLLAFGMFLISVAMFIAFSLILVDAQ